MDDDALIDKLNAIGAEIRHEDGLIGQRVMWLVISQSFLFGTFATLLGQRGPGERGDAVQGMLILIALVGVLMPPVVLVAILAANYAIREWRAEQDRICRGREAGQQDWPRLRHRTLVTALGHLLPIAISVGFTLAWVVIMVRMRTL